MTAEKRRRTGQSAKPAKTMADYAMSFDRLGLWMSERAKSTTLRHPQATSLSMLDGAIAAVVGGPVSMMPEEWVCPLLGVDPDDFNHDTETFSAIAATLIIAKNPCNSPMTVNQASKAVATIGFQQNRRIPAANRVAGSHLWVSALMGTANKPDDGDFRPPAAHCDPTATFCMETRQASIKPPRHRISSV